ncbi:MAG: autotransporter outer membrane beta-barrel domain-containing protein, partial [Candidatus Competibacteraceae bacterium]|nr:autotransporter outer membrane beta-barrel domain-containing protein [Candidatus Competibacteraceae bacterium]
PLGNYRPAVGDEVIFLTTGEGLTAFSPALLDVSALDPALDYAVATRSGSLLFTVTTAPTPELEEELLQVAASPSQRSVGQTLADACRRATGALLADCRALAQAGLDPNLPQALEAISPEEVVAPADTAQGGATGQTRRVGARLKALRSGATPISLDRVTFHLEDGRVLGAADLNRLLGSGGAAGDGQDSPETLEASFGPWGVFVDGNIGLGDKDPTASETGYEFEVYSLTLGADYRLNRETILGAALDYARTDTELDQDGGQVDSDSLTLNLYGSYYPGERWFVDGLVGYGRLDFDQQRRIRYALATGTQVNQSADADYDGDQWIVSLGTGYNLERGALSFGPEGRLQYTRTELDAFRERIGNPDAPGGGLAVAMEEQDVESLTLNLGGQASYALSQSWGVLVPQARLEWVHEFRDDSRGITGRFAEDPAGERFTIRTDDPDRNYFNLGLGASAVFPGGLNAYAYYEAVLGYEDLDHQSLGVGVRWEF